MSDHRPGLGPFLYRLVRRDIGRKVTAAFLAVLLFVAIDRQVRDEQKVSVPIHYKSLDQLQSGNYERSQGWKLIVVTPMTEDGRSLVVPEKGGRPKSISMQVSGPRAVLESLRLEEVIGCYYPDRAGTAIPVSLAEIRSLEGVRGFDHLRERLGADHVEFTEDLLLNVAAEDVLPFVPTKENLKVEGEAAAGWKLDAVSFEPNLLHIEGVASDLEVLRVDPKSLFSRVNLTGLKDRVVVELKLNPGRSGTLRLGSDSLRPTATLTFTRVLVPVPVEKGGVFPRLVTLRCDPNLLDTDDKKLYAQGYRPVFEDPGTSTLDVQLYLPESEVRVDGPSFVQDPIRDRIELVAPVEQWTTNNGEKKVSVPVHVYIRASEEDQRAFEVHVLDPERPDLLKPADVEMKVEWRKPGADDPKEAEAGTEGGDRP